MTLVYRIFQGDAADGPVDYATVTETVSVPTYVGEPLAPSSRTRFAVRAYDTDTGLDDGNRDVAATVALDASGNDVSGTPGPILNLKARAGAAGTIILSWVHHPAGRPIPAGFRAWATAGPTVDYATAPALTQSFAPIAYDASGGRFSGTISGLTPGTAYAVGVRAFNAAGADPGTVSASATPVAAGPSPVLGLSLTATLPSGSPTGRAIPGTAP